MSAPTATGPGAAPGAAFDLGRTGRTFADCRAQGRGALVGFLHVGYPDVPRSLAALRALAGDGEGTGVDLVEVGMPYSDPMMDGVTIQRAGTRALERGVRTADAFAAVEAVASTGTPAVVMTYWNLIERYGPDRFARDLAAAGGAGAITPDLTPDEAEEWLSVSDAHGLDRIFLVSPSSTDERLAATVAACRGWVYATSVMGVTGARTQTSSAAPALVERIRAVAPDAAVGVGLGVSDGAQAREVLGFADAVIVGSALVRALLEAEDAGRPDDLSRLRAVVADLVEGVRSGTSAPLAR
ncbi:tryptophan synthase subunit alpha [Microlunatus capsulatus]|uniref:Tryptophan synthase alpha chain n=1 Tax=Microlunatus capsulatus TaxID=99117 RepID=A0ABS4Z3C9_9ACTN|nr:tryptophan synthase subunit alpha [Microlunatus capsulatus]MBP2415556.1 tryptophan synthase alpha chain [Microlunatus capsulatus]